MEWIFWIIWIISAVSLALFVFSIVMVFVSLIKSKKQTNSMLGSNAFTQLSNYIFSNGRPAQIIITLKNEIFFGPFDGTFQQVPVNMVPPMDNLQRRSLGKAFAQAHNYSNMITIDPQEPNLGPYRTGLGYIDSNIDIVITGNVATGSW